MSALKYRPHWLSQALSKWTHKSTQVDANFQLAFDWHFIWPPTCVDVCWLVITCVYFHWIQICTFFAIWPPHASWHKLIASDLCTCMHEVCNFLWLVSWLANLFGHPSQVCVQALVLQTCVDLWFCFARVFSNTPHRWTDTQGCGLGLADVKLSPFIDITLFGKHKRRRKN